MKASNMTHSAKKKKKKSYMTLSFAWLELFQLPIAGP